MTVIRLKVSYAAHTQLRIKKSSKLVQGSFYGHIIFPVSDLLP